ncbi:hypothetical protein FM036_40920 [Nostoc sp. HG1]|nr:hypothetical protein [Nostoc sp. HG1]
MADIKSFVTQRSIRCKPYNPERTPDLSPSDSRKILKLKLQQGLDSAGQFYQQLVSTIGSAVGIADGEPYTEGIPGAVAGLG